MFEENDDRQAVSWPSRYCAGSQHGSWKLRAHGCCCLCGPLQDSHLWHFGKLQNNHHTLFQSCATPYQTNVVHSTLNVLVFFPSRLYLKNMKVWKIQQWRVKNRVIQIDIMSITRYYTMYCTVKKRTSSSYDIRMSSIVFMGLLYLQ